MSRNSILFISGRGIRFVEGQQFPTPTTAASTFPKVVSVSSYNPKLSCSKIISTNHLTIRNIFKLSFEVVGFSRMASATEGEHGRLFKLSATTELKIQRGDITKWFVDGSSDAIVSVSRTSPLV